MKRWIRTHVIDNITYQWNLDKQRFLWNAVLGLSVIGVGVGLHNNVPTPSAEVNRAWVQVGLMVLSVGLSILAGRLLAKKSDSPIKDDKPTTLSTRGSYTNWWVGVRLVGPVFCWAGDREIRKEKVEGAGKGGSAPEQDVFYEAGWHVLGVGPVTALHQIIQGGKIIFDGPITNVSHPSGSTVGLGKEGSFTIYWGEPGQPINAFLGNANRVTVSSRWPHACYVVWNKKRLSSSPTWPILNYVMERQPSRAVLTGSSAWYEPATTLSGTQYTVTSSLANADEDVGYLQFNGDKTSVFRPTTIIALVGNGLPDADYTVLRSTVVMVTTGTTFNGYPIQKPRTRVFLEGGTVGATTAGTAEPYDVDDTDGANIAHIIDELLFADFPQGLQIDPNHAVEKWDIPSLEALGTEAETAAWRSSVVGTEGETAEAMLGAMLQDHGVMLPINTATGYLFFQRVREPSGTLPNLSDAIYANKQPEIETIHGEQPVDSLIFAFSDRANRFGDMTIVIDEDGQASYMEHQRARKVPIVSTVHFDTAAALTELRSQEELPPGAEFRIDAAREARDLIPGDAITASGFDEVLRVTGVEIDPLSEAVTLKVIPDFYGVPISTFIANQGGLPATPLAPEPDEQFAWVEVAEHVLGSFPQTQTILIPRIRNHSLISFASLWLSRDDVTYTLFGNDPLVQTGGTLNDALTVEGPAYVTQGPEYTELGPDNATLTQDLSADLANWGLGRQLAVIVSTAGTEVCFLQKATITGAGIRRLDGLLRSRYHTRRLAHPVGAEVYIFDVDAITPVQDILLEPAEDLYVKTQPGTTAGQVNLSAVPPYGELLRGEGQVPIKPDYVHVRAPFLNVPAFQTGDNITVSWAISTAASTGTGAGYQSAGTAISAPDIPGTVQIELRTTGNVLKATIGVDASAATEYTITNAALVAAFAGEPTAFKVRVTHVANGQSSPVSEYLTITRVA